MTQEEGQNSGRAREGREEDGNSVLGAELLRI